MLTDKLKYYVTNIKQSFGKGIIFLPILFCFILSTIVVSANANNYKQNDCRYITFQNRFIKNYQSTTIEKSSLEFENSKCLRPWLLKNKEKNIPIADEKEIIFPSQNCLDVELVKETREFKFGSAISGNDFSNQKSYIRLGGAEHVGKVAGVAARSSSRIVNTSAKQLQKKFKHAGDFGVKGNYNKVNAGKFNSAINQHINSPGVKVINGTYRGNPVTHYLDPNTGLNLIVNPNGSFHSGWRLGSEQLMNVLKHGGLN